MYKYEIVNVRRVVDGDTLDVTVDLGFSIFHNITIRLLGINAPETRTRDLEEKAKGLEAKDFLRIFMDDNKDSSMMLESSELDSFGRSLGIVYVDGENISDLMLREGHAVPYDK
jgi:endonuclease YncB( thermonuclease family)